MSNDTQQQILASLQNIEALLETIYSHMTGYRYRTSAQRKEDSINDVMLSDLIIVGLLQVDDILAAKKEEAPVFLRVVNSKGYLLPIDEDGNGAGDIFTTLSAATHVNLGTLENISSLWTVKRTGQRLRELQELAVNLI